SSTTSPAPARSATGRSSNWNTRRTLMATAATFHPSGDRVLVRRDEAPEKIGRIFVPEAAKEAPLEGTVLAVGPGARRDDGTREPMDVQVGDHVLFGRYSAEVTKPFDDPAVYLMRVREIFAVLG